MLSRLDRQGVSVISSHNLASICNVGASQLRKDMMLIPGASGKQSVGYSVKVLLSSIQQMLHRDQNDRVVLVGVGSFGAALIKYRGFEAHGFEIVAAFDLQPSVIENSDIPVYSMESLESFLQEHKIKFAILAVPESAAKNVADQLIRFGVTRLLNLTPALLTVPDSVKVSDVNLVYEMEFLRRQL